MYWFVQLCREQLWLPGDLPEEKRGPSVEEVAPDNVDSDTWTTRKTLRQDDPSSLAKKAFEGTIVACSSSHYSRFEPSRLLKLFDSTKAGFNIRWSAGLV